MHRALPLTERSKSSDGLEADRRFIRWGSVAGLVVAYATLVPLKLVGIMPEQSWWQIIVGPIGLFGMIALFGIVPVYLMAPRSGEVEEAPRKCVPQRVARNIIVLAILCWGGFLAGLLPVEPGRGVLPEFISAITSASVVISTLGAGAAVWAAFRTRQQIALVAILLFLPLSVVGWWKMISGA